MATEDLWGDLPKAADSVNMPKSILEEQASLLSEKTNRILEGYIDAEHDSPDSALFSLYVVVPRLGDYKYGVTRLQYNPIHVDPAKVFDITESKVFEVNDEKELQSALKAIFSKPGLRKSDQLAFEASPG